MTYFLVLCITSEKPNKNGFVLRCLSLFSSFWLESSHFLIHSGIKAFFLHIGPFPLSKWIGYQEKKIQKINDNEFTRDKTEFLLYPLHMFWFLKSQKWSVIVTILHFIVSKRLKRWFEHFTVTSSRLFYLVSKELELSFNWLMRLCWDRIPQRQSL